LVIAPPALRIDVWTAPILPTAPRFKPASVFRWVVPAAVVHMGTFAVLPELASCPTLTRDPHAEPLYAVSVARLADALLADAAGAVDEITTAQLAAAAMSVTRRHLRPALRQAVRDSQQATRESLIGGMVDPLRSYLRSCGRSSVATPI
jgi:hypothetical protein